MTPESGVPLDVATRRAANISALRYEMALAIPEAVASPLTGTETVRFDLKDASSPLVIDFETSREHVKSVEANGKQELLSIKIDREVINPDDAQMLEDLVMAACNEALRKSREMVQSEMGKGSLFSMYLPEESER